MEQTFEEDGLRMKSRSKTKSSKARARDEGSGSEHTGERSNKKSRHKNGSGVQNRSSGAENAGKNSGDKSIRSGKSFKEDDEIKRQKDYEKQYEKSKR